MTLLWLLANHHDTKKPQRTWLRPKQYVLRFILISVFEKYSTFLNDVFFFSAPPLWSVVCRAK